MLMSRDVIVDERAKGSKGGPKSEFEVSPGKALGKKAVVNGRTQNEKEDEKKDGEVEDDIGETEEMGKDGERVERRYPTR